MRHLLLTMAACTAALTAQDTDNTTTRGAWAAMPIGMTLKKTSNTTNDILVKLSGDRTVEPAALGTPPLDGTPDFRLSAMFHMFPAEVQQLIDIDAMSTGNDNLHYDESGVIIGDAAGGWSTIFVCVDSNATGIPGGPLADRLADAQNNVAADVYSYTFPDSNTIEDWMLGTAVLEVPSQAMQLPIGKDVSAFDVALPFIAAIGTGGDAFVTTTHKFYFSLTRASALAVTQATNFANGPVNGATILEITWTPGSGTTAGSWSSPTIFKSHTDLGLAAEDDVDALTVNRTTSPFDILLSTTNTQDPRGQILALVGQNTSTPNLVAARDSTGTRIPPGVKLNGPDNVTALAGMDPDAMRYSRLLSTPVEPALTWVNGQPDPLNSLTPRGTRPLGMSVVAELSSDCFSLTNNTIVQVSGWGIPGYANRTPGLLEFYVTPPEYLAGATRLMGLTRSINQHTMRLVMPIPTGFFGELGLVARFVPGHGLQVPTWSYVGAMDF